MARVRVYTTPVCPYCVRAKRLLESRGIAFEEIDVSEDDALRGEIIQRTGRRTVPQIFIDGRSIGGFEELLALDVAGELAGLGGRRVSRLALAALVSGLVTAAVAADDGARLYRDRCAGCHGATGGGDGPAAAAFDPPPRNFRDEVFWKGRSAADVRRVVREGKPGTLMPPFTGTLSDAEIDAVVGYVESLRSAPR